jgi:glycine/D-amino acid oxidase-like deaminating enzyme
MPTTYDAVVIGAGHNGLTCACYLASAGLSGSSSTSTAWSAG